MSGLVKDFLHESTLNLMLDYYSGLKQIRSARARGKKICSVMVALATELVEASGSVSISLYRLGRFIADRELRLMRLSKNIFGTGSLVSSLSFISATLGPKQILNLAEKGILGGLWKIYHENINLAKEKQYPLDACFGTRIYYGSLVRFQKEIDFSIGYGTRCGWFTKFFESASKIKPLVFIDMPINFKEEALAYQIDEIYRVIAEIESITGNKVTEDSLREEIRLHNSIAESYKEIFNIWARDISAVSPLGFIYILSMLHFGYTDRLSKSSKYFDRLLKDLVKDFKANLKVDLTENPKLLFAPMFGGFDPEIMKLVSDLGGRLLFSDWLA
ncbi:MAG: 2-hydroxyacyl-CoA dehydratase, partial [Promethearchaeota archaeon]